MHEALRFISSPSIRIWQCMSISPMLEENWWEGVKVEDQKFKAIFSYIASFSPAWVAQHFVFRKNIKKEILFCQS